MRGFTPTPEQASLSEKCAKRNGCLVWGFTLLEVIIAIFIITISAGGVFTLLQRTISSASVANDQFIASYLLEEGVEIVHNLRDTNFIQITNGATSTWKYGIADLDGNGADDCSAGCEVDYDDTALVQADRLLKIDSSGYYNYSAGTNTSFKRKVKVISVGDDKMEVAVEVSWEGRTIEAATELYNWAHL